jgi:hypothetical protein
MKWVKFSAYGILLIYSAILINLNVRFGDEYVRAYFSDIVPNQKFGIGYQSLFGINTSLTMLFLTGSALLFALCICFGHRENEDWKIVFFQWSQMGIYGYLAMDERLRFHEWGGLRFGIEDAFIILGIGLCEVFLLIALWGIFKRAWRFKSCLYASGAFFGMMVFVDATQKMGIPGRLAFEDLTKLWATVFLFVFSWRYCMDWIGADSSRQEA